MKQLKFFKNGEAPIWPQRGTRSSAGIDFYIPNLKDRDDVYLITLKHKIIEELEKQNKSDFVVSFLSRISMYYQENNLTKLFWTHIIWYNYAVFNNNLTQEFNMDKSSFTIPSGEHVVIPTGITANIPEGYCITMLNKSGIATKKSLVVGAQLIDEDYTGIIHLDIHNISNDDAQISMGDKITQGVIMESHCYDIELLNCEGENDKGQTERGAGGFGSTGTK